LIQAKVKGHDIVAPKHEEEEPQVLNLMDALKQSVAHAHSDRKVKKTRKRRRSA
jgi:non-homologous end joining protein Ku